MKQTTPAELKLITNVTPAKPISIPDMIICRMLTVDPVVILE